MSIYIHVRLRSYFSPQQLHLTHAFPYLSICLRLIKIRGTCTLGQCSVHCTSRGTMDRASDPIRIMSPA